MADYGLPYEPRPYHHKAFRIEQLPEVVNEYGLPPDDPDPIYDGYQNRTFEKYIEVQVWSDTPVESFLRAPG